MPRVLPSWSFNVAVISYVVESIERDNDAAYFVLAGNADTSLAVVGTVILIVLFVAVFVVKLSTVVLFF